MIPSWRCRPRRPQIRREPRLQEAPAEVAGASRRDPLVSPVTNPRPGARAALVALADHGEVFEITREGDVVWRYLSPARDDEGKRSTLHRARRYETEFIDGLIEKYGSDPNYR